MRDRLDHGEAERLTVIEVKVHLLPLELLKHAPGRVADPKKRRAVGVLKAVTVGGHLQFPVLLPSRNGGQGDGGKQKAADGGGEGSFRASFHGLLGSRRWDEEESGFTGGYFTVMTTRW